MRATLAFDDIVVDRAARIAATTGDERHDDGEAGDEPNEVTDALSSGPDGFGRRVGCHRRPVSQHNGRFGGHHRPAETSMHVPAGRVLTR